MHKCIPYANIYTFMMIRNWVLTGMGGTHECVPYEHMLTNSNLLGMPREADMHIL